MSTPRGKSCQDSTIAVFLNVRLVRGDAGYSAQEKYVFFWLGLAKSFRQMVICAPTSVSDEPEQFPLEFDSRRVSICELPYYSSSMELYWNFLAIRRESLRRVEGVLTKCDIFVAVVPNLLGLSLSRSAEKKNVPCAFYVRGDLRNTVRFEYRNSWRRHIAVPLSMLLEWVTRRRARRTLTFVVGEALARQYSQNGILAQPIITSLIRDRDIVPGRSSQQFKSQKGRILSIGRLSPERGVDVLLEAVAKLQKDPGKLISLRVIGDGPELTRLRNLAAALQLKNVKFDGYVSDSALLQTALQEANLLVISSYTEGLPKVVLESLASGCPIVSTAVGGIPDLLVDGETGVLVPPGDVCQLASAIDKVISRPKFAAELSRSGNLLIRQQTFEAQRDIFCSILQGN